MDEFYGRRGFLPATDPLPRFPDGSPYAILDEIGRELPLRLEDPEFRAWGEGLSIPRWDQPLGATTLPELQLYYLRLGFLASGYINQVGFERSHRLPANIAEPLIDACRTLERPPILSYDGYALYNWYRQDPNGPIALGNIDTIQNFVSLYDEHWFVLVHVEIEAMAAGIINAVLQYDDGTLPIDDALVTITEIVQDQGAVLRRIPEHMSPDLYFKTFRPYIRFFDKVLYEGKSPRCVSYRGETGAQSSVIPLLVAFFKIPHEPNALTRHVDDLRQYMPCPHRSLLERVESMPTIKEHADPVVFDSALEAIADFRSIHYGWAKQYIHDRVDDPRGTGGTPYMSWLRQLIDETLAFRAVSG